MSLIEDARRLAEGNPVQDVGYEATVNRCPFCCAENRPHAEDCEWLALPRIVAALEAAEVYVQDIQDKSTTMRNLRRVQSYHALVAALRGEEVTA